jgi:hypothetical protein
MYAVMDSRPISIKNAHTTVGRFPILKTLDGDSLNTTMVNRRVDTINEDWAPSGPSVDQAAACSFFTDELANLRGHN